MPTKFLIQTEQGTFDEVVVVDLKQIVSQINEATYDILIVAELNLDIREFPKLKAYNIRDTRLVRIAIKESDIEKAKRILFSVFNPLKRDLDKKIDIEIKDIDTQIASKENLIKQNEISIKDHNNQIALKNLQIKDKKNGIKKKNNDIQLKELGTKSKEIKKDSIKKEIESFQNKLKISENRVKTILDEMKSVKKRIDELEEQQRKDLAEKKQGGDAISLLLYSNEVQQNFRYYNTLDEKLSNEKITQENLNLSIRDKEEQLRQIDNQIEQINTQKETIKTEIDDIKTQIVMVNTEIEKIKNTINIQNTEIRLLEDKKARIDYTQLIKEPTPSIGPVSPKKKLYVLIAGFLGLITFTMLAFFLEYFKKQRVESKG